jgi:hypothetical protein
MGANKEMKRYESLARRSLGTQIWLERTDSVEHIHHLFEEARNCGIGWVRLFLMWPWIEPEAEQWDFTIFDYAFEAARKNDILIKATITANSGPHHIGTPSMLHSHTGFLGQEQREPMRRYISQCVERYKGHPALGQWILWNEPQGGWERTEETLSLWRHWLKEAYGGRLAELNRRWLTGYKSFEEIPFAENIPHPLHRGSSWNSYRPWMDDCKFRAEWLSSEMKWINDTIRESDRDTEVCVNPVPLLSNPAAWGNELDLTGEFVDIVGASYHPGWHFMFADRATFPALMVAGIRKQAAHPAVNRVEVTEVQTGNTLNSAIKPCAVTPHEIARYHLAGLAAGAESVTGWCFNIRSQDWEAGDWGLLDNQDRQSGRSRMLRKLFERLTHAYSITGRWHASAPNAWIGYDPRSQSLEWIESKMAPGLPGRMSDDGAHGTALLSTSLFNLGVNNDIVKMAYLPEKAEFAGQLIILSHQLCWEREDAERLMSFVESGGRLLVDGTSGRKTYDAAMHRPWPGHLGERLGFRAKDLETRPEGYEISLNGFKSGKWVTSRMDAEFNADAGWRQWDELRFMTDGTGCIWERSYGKGTVFVSRGLLGPSLVHEWQDRQTITYVLNRIGSHIKGVIAPASSNTDTIVIPVRVEHGTLHVVIGPDLLERKGQMLRLQVDEKPYVDLWTGVTVHSDTPGEISLSAEEGVALLWSR